MEIKELQKIKEKLPAQYGKEIADIIADPNIDNITVSRVFNGEITDMAIVTTVIDGATKLIRARKKLQSKIKTALKA